MSRSFVRTWATVVTLMALACFAFVQPMPEYVAGSAGQTGKALQLQVSEGQLTESPPFVDTVLTGKSYTPIAMAPVVPVLHVGGSRPVSQTRGGGNLPIRPPDPLIRPG